MLQTNCQGQGVQVSPPWYWGDPVRTSEFLAAVTKVQTMLGCSHEVVLSEVADTGANAIPYQAGDILNVVGIVT